MGEVDNSVIFPGVLIGAGVKVNNSIIMHYGKIEEDAIVNGAIITQNTVVTANTVDNAGSGIIHVTVKWQMPDNAAKAQICLAG